MNIRSSIGFIGVGQAGGNICSLFEAKGFSALYINTSLEDLNTLGKAKNIFHLAGGEGTAKERERAKELVIDNFNDVSDAIEIVLGQTEFIFVVFSAGGGTGSGISPLLIDYLSQEMKEKTICAVTILPAASELIKAQSNAFECLKELSLLDNLSATFVIDNNGQRDKMAVNDVFVSLFDSMLEIPSHVSRKGSIDAAEVKKLLKARGCAHISRLYKENSSTPRLCDSFVNGIFAPAEPNGAIKYIAITMASAIDMEIVYKRVGKPIDLFQGYNQSETVCVLSGLSFPVARLDNLKKQIIEDKNELQARISGAKRFVIDDSGFDPSLEFVSQAEKSSQKMTQQDLFAKYRKKKQ